ncbi:hypothetical protein TanjilG_25692 [Lupinus angustifolius]|uniref:Uncharacterized protein n=1 Tax=Lupinus angustifolius TaxID=3871 RepID=A0A1J7FMN7_LUPAN|nr:hypothetical protein TanjilG_25692 [Lupinus angustifolius]
MGLKSRISFLSSLQRWQWRARDSHRRKRTMTTLLRHAIFIPSLFSVLLISAARQRERFMAKPSLPKRPIDGEASKPPSFFVYGSGQPRARRYWFVMVVIRGGSADEGGITMLKTNYYGDLKKATHGYSLLC